MLTAFVWGLVQGLTEFLPVSSSGHLVIVPAYMSRLGVDIAPPELAMSAVLHLGTLAAVLTYFRSDVARMLRFRRDAEGRRLLALVFIGSLPVIIGLPLQGILETFQQTVSNVGWALVGTGVILLIGQRAAQGVRGLEGGRPRDALAVGVAQALALVPGISRAGSTIAAGSLRGFRPTEAARFSFLLGIPATAGAGLLQVPGLAGAGQLGWELALGFVTATISGYIAISALLAAIRRVGLAPFAAYTLAIGFVTIVLFR